MAEPRWSRGFARPSHGNIARGFAYRPGKDDRISREHGQLSVAPQAALPKLADLTDKTIFV
jgi:hypothetical protein